MQHYDEHILELFVLEAEEAKELAPLIRAHLQVCAGCRESVERIKLFYAQAEQSVSDERPDLKRPTNAIARTDRRLDVFFGTSAGGGGGLEKVRPRGLTGLIRNYPVKSSIGAGFLIVVAVLLAQWKFGPSRVNPEYTVLNNEKRFLEVYSGKNELLWSIPWGHTNSFIGPLRSTQMSPAKVADLDGDGENEVITAMSHLGGIHVPAANVRVFAADGSLLWEKAFEESLTFGNQSFPPSFFVRGLVVGDFNADGKKEMIVNVPHRHSPQLLVRFDHEGRELGRYAHFGHFFSLELIDLDGDRRQELIASGIDDVDSAAAIAVLDPSKIVGSVESQITQGFGFKVSDAEKKYVRLPKNEFDFHLLQKPRIFGITTIDDGLIWFSGGAEYPTSESGRGYSMDYLFGRNMGLKEIKLTDSGRMAYERLRREGLFLGKLDETFLKDLEERVLYWDGKEWSKEAENETKAGQAAER